MAALDPYDPQAERARQEAERAAASMSADQILAAQQARSALGSGERLPTAPMPVPPSAATVRDPTVEDRAAAPMPTQQALPPPSAADIQQRRSAAFSAAGPSPSLGEQSEAIAKSVITGAGKAGQAILNAPAAIGNALASGAEAESTALGLTPPKEEAGTRPYKGTTPPKTEEPTVVESSAPTEPPKPGVLDTIKPKGAPGGPRPPATRGRTRDELPDALPKAAISPTYLVELEKSNPALHDGIIQAAQAAGIGSWDYANLIYASSKGDPNYNAGGRVGLAGLSQQDIDRYRQERPELFRDSQGNPVTAQDPHTSLMLGALKYREMRDNYGAKTPMSILAYHLGQEKVDALARVNSPSQQQAMLPPNANDLVQQSVVGPDAGKPYVTPTPVTLNPPGTATPMATYQAAAQAARTGNAMPFISYAINSVPRGMGSNDAWRYLENQMVSTMIAKGNMEGAQAARELVFQMSHVGSNQALMSAYKLMQMGDYHGSAQQLALAYWAAPDGGLAQFAVGKGKDGKPMMIGRRYNEDTHSPVGDAFEVTPERLIGMMNVTHDPNAFAKIMRDNQKLHADIADKEADTQLKLGKVKYYEDLIPAADRRAAAHEEAAAAAALVRATKPATGAGKPAPVDPRVAHVDKLVHDAYTKIDPVTQQAIPASPEEAFERNIVHNMKMNDDSLEVSRGATIAKDVVVNRNGGLYGVFPHTKKPGWGAVINKKTGATVGELDPSTMTQFKPAAAKPTAGAAPARQPAPGSALGAGV